MSSPIAAWGERDSNAGFLTPNDVVITGLLLSPDRFQDDCRLQSTSVRDLARGQQQESVILGRGTCFRPAGYSNG